MEALSRPPGLCRIYLFTWELSSERGAEGIRVLSRGPSHSSLEAETSRKVGRRGERGKTRVELCLVWNPALFWLEPEKGLGKQGGRLLGS